MIEFAKKHKIAVLVAIILILVGAVAAAVLVSGRMQGDFPGKDAAVTNDLGDFPADAEVHGSDDGEVIIGATADSEDGQAPAVTSMSLTDSPESIWISADTYAGNHTPVEAAKMEDGSIGVLTIPALRLSVNVYESEDTMEAMSRGVAHFPSTSAFDGNVGVSAHNINLDGSDGYFKQLHTLKLGDVVTLKTALGERTYTVSSSTAIAASDWSPLHYTDDNRLTMITCISGKPDQRLCVQAVEQQS